MHPGSIRHRTPLLKHATILKTPLHHLNQFIQPIQSIHPPIPLVLYGTEVQARDMASICPRQMPCSATVSGTHVQHARGGGDGLGAGSEALDGVVGGRGEGEGGGLVDADGDLGTAPDGVVECVGGGVVVVGAGGGGGGWGGHDWAGGLQGGRNWELWSFMVQMELL